MHDFKLDDQACDRLEFDETISQFSFLFQFSNNFFFFVCCFLSLSLMSHVLSLQRITIPSDGGTHLFLPSRNSLAIPSLY